MRHLLAVRSEDQSKTVQ